MPNRNAHDLHLQQCIITKHSRPDEGATYALPLCMHKYSFGHFASNSMKHHDTFSVQCTDYFTGNMYTGKRTTTTKIILRTSYVRNFHSPRPYIYYIFRQAHILGTPQPGDIRRSCMMMK